MGYPKWKIGMSLQTPSIVHISENATRMSTRYKSFQSLFTIAEQHGTLLVPNAIDLVTEHACMLFSCCARHFCCLYKSRPNHGGGGGGWGATTWPLGSFC